MTLNGTDVTGAFALRENGRYEGLVTGLALGGNVLVARPEHGIGRRIRIRNHPIGGPVFAGPQVTPFFCNPNVSNPPLGDAIDAQCNAPMKVELLYRNTATPAQFLSYDPASPPPSGAIAQTTTDAGVTVPFIVQRVTGTAARGIYQIGGARRPVEADHAVVDEPAVEPQASTPSAARVGTSTSSAHPATCFKRPSSARLRRRDVQPQHLCQQLQRRHLR